jgi:protein-disulfide isomerase
MKLFCASLFATAALALTVFLPMNASAEEAKAMSKPEMEALVKKVIQENPDLIFQTLLDYQNKTEANRMSRATLNMAKMQDKISHDPHSPSIGNPNGDVTIIEFFDYHCGYCKRFFPEIPKLLEEDKNVRFVFKEFPILSPDSALAARAALAVHTIDSKKYFDYHIELMNARGSFTEKSLTEIATHIGIAPEAFKKAFDAPEVMAYLNETKKEAESLGIQATPAVIVGTQLLPGAVPYEDLKERIDEVRDGQKQRALAKGKDEK